MGSKSSPQQSTASTNISTSYGLQDSTGVFGNNNAITYNMSDGGLINGVTNIASDLMSALKAVSGDMTASTGRIIDSAEYSVTEMADFAGRAIQENSGLAKDVVFAGNDLAKELSLENAQLARDSLSFGGDLLAGFANELSAARKESTDAIVKTNQYALQYADHMSRSDGQQLALDSNKTLMYVLLGFAGLSAVAMLAKR